MNELEKTNHIILLIDMYGELLTEKQQTYLEMYYEEDLSLAEIADILEDAKQKAYRIMQKQGLKIKKSYNNFQSNSYI